MLLRSQQIKAIIGEKKSCENNIVSLSVAVITIILSCQDVNNMNDNEYSD